MKKVFKKNQIVIAVLAVMIAAAGYLNYSGKIFGSKNKTAETGSEMANKELLDISDQDTGSDSSLQTVDNDQVDGNPGEAVLTNGSVSALVAQAKVNREQVRAKNKETLQAIIDNADIAEDQKADAVAQMVEMTQRAEQEVAIETLLASKGFQDAVVSLTEESADVVVDVADLSDAKRAQIEDIVKRKTGVAAESIVITPLSQSKEAADDNTSDAPDTAADAAGAENATDTKDTAGSEGNEAQDTAASAESDPADSGSEDKETAAGAQNDPTIDTEGIYD